MHAHELNSLQNGVAFNLTAPKFVYVTNSLLCMCASTLFIQFSKGKKWLSTIFKMKKNIFIVV